MNVGENALRFLQDNVTMDETGTGHVTQKKYIEFMGTMGVTKEVLDVMNAAHGELYNGMYRYNHHALSTSVDEAKKNGTDPTKQKVVLSINVPNGSVTMTTSAAKSYPIPRQPGETITKTMVTSLDIRQVRHFDKELCRSCEDEMRRQLGI